MFRTAVNDLGPLMRLPKQVPGLSRRWRPAVECLEDRSLLSGVFGTNLIVNGDAEAGAGSATGLDVIRPIPGWTPTGNFTVIRYAAGGGFPTATDPGPANRGSNFFGGGPSNAGSSQSQVIDVSAGAATIDEGHVTFTLSGYLGGYATDDDNAVLTATFLNAAGASLRTATIGPVTPADRGNATALLQRSSPGSVPAGTRSVNVVLQMTRLDGSSNDGYADNLSLVLAQGSNAGTLDPTFGSGGLVLTPFPGSTDDVAKSVAVDSRGRILVAGQSYQGGFVKSALARYLPSGALDTSFGTNGFVRTAFPNSIDDRAVAVAVQSDGDIVVAGTSIQNNNAHAFALARYTPSGALDTAFGTNGFVLTSFTTAALDAAAMTVDSQGNIVVAGTLTQLGSTNKQFVVARYTSAGVLDTSFNGGVVLSQFPSSTNDVATSVAVRADGSVLVAGISSPVGSNRVGLVQYTPAGVPDSAFATGGFVRSVYSGDTGDFAFGVAVERDTGKVVVAGQAARAGGPQIVVARYMPDGKSLDPSFGSGGAVHTAVPGATGAVANSVAVDALGNIIVAGSSTQGGAFGFAVAQYTPAGALDSTFGTAGIVTTSFPGSASSNANSLAVQSDGNIVVAGQATASSGSNQFALARYLEIGQNAALRATGTPVIENGVENGTPEEANNTTVHVQFIDSNPNADSSHYTVISTIDWGDGTTPTPVSLVDIQFVSSSSTSTTWQISAAHTYRDAGLYAIRVHVVNRGGSTLDIPAGTADVANRPLLVDSQVTSVEVDTSGNPLVKGGAPFSGELLTFTNEDTIVRAPGDYRVTIDWGDGTSSTVVPTRDAGDPMNQFHVAGTHSFARAGNLTIRVTITDIRDRHPTQQSVSADISATVAEPPVTVTVTAPPQGIPQARAGQIFNGIVAAINGSPTASPADFSGIITWGAGGGDPTPFGPGDITAAQTPGQFLIHVSGTHTFPSAGSFTVTVQLTVQHPGSPPFTVTNEVGTVTVVPPGGPGSVDKLVQDLKQNISLQTKLKLGLDALLKKFRPGKGKAGPPKQRLRRGILNILASDMELSNQVNAIASAAGEDPTVQSLVQGFKALEIILQIKGRKALSGGPK